MKAIFWMAQDKEIVQEDIKEIHISPFCIFVILIDGCEFSLSVEDVKSYTIVDTELPC